MSGLHRLLVDLTAEHDDGDRFDSVALPNVAQHLPAVHLRHHHVEQDEIGRLLVQRFEPFRGACGLSDEIALHLEVDPQVFPQPLVVVDDEDERTRPLGRTGSAEERIEVVTAEPAMASRRVEGG